MESATEQLEKTENPAKPAKIKVFDEKKIEPDSRPQTRVNYETPVDPLREMPSPKEVKKRAEEVRAALDKVIARGGPGRLNFLKQNIRDIEFDEDDFVMRFRHVGMKTALDTDTHKTRQQQVLRDAVINVSPEIPIKDILNGVALQCMNAT